MDSSDTEDHSSSKEPQNPRKTQQLPSNSNGTKQDNSSNMDIAMKAMLDSLSLTPKGFSSFLESTCIPGSHSCTELSSFPGFSTRTVVDSDSVLLNLSSQIQEGRGRQDETGCKQFWGHFKMQDVKYERFHDAVKCEELDNVNAIKSKEKGIPGCDSEKISKQMYGNRIHTFGELDVGHTDNEVYKTCNERFTESTDLFWTDLLQEIDEFRSERQEEDGPHPDFWKKIQERLEEYLKSIQSRYCQDTPGDEIESSQNQCCATPSDITNNTSSIKSIIDYNDIKDSDEDSCREVKIICCPEDGKTWSEFIDRKICNIEALKKKYTDVFEEYNQHRLCNLRKLHALQCFSKKDVDGVISDIVDRNDNINPNAMSDIDNIDMNDNSNANVVSDIDNIDINDNINANVVSDIDNIDINDNINANVMSDIDNIDRNDNINANDISDIYNSDSNDNNDKVMKSAVDYLYRNFDSELSKLRHDIGLYESNIDAKDATSTDLTCCESKTDSGIRADYICQDTERLLKDLEERLKVSDVSLCPETCFNLEAIGISCELKRYEAYANPINCNENKFTCTLCNERVESIGESFSKSVRLEKKKRQEESEAEEKRKEECEAEKISDKTEEQSDSEEKKTCDEFIEMTRHKMRDLLNQRNRIMKLLQEESEDIDYTTTETCSDGETTDAEITEPSRTDTECGQWTVVCSDSETIEPMSTDTTDTDTDMTNNPSYMMDSNENPCL